MNWKDYEKEVHKYFSQMYPQSTITYDARIVGRYSKHERQVDVLIEDDVAGFLIRIVVDAKYFSKKIDVKCVESFISMLEDMNVSQGLLITQKGYSQAAINRAYYGPQKLELDILNFDKLLEFQGVAAIPYSGSSAIEISSPFGWIVDNRKSNGFIACLYQRGITLEEAQKKQEWIYFNFWGKDENVSNIKELVLMQNTKMSSIYTNLRINESRSPIRKDGLDTYIRIAQFDELSCNEITGYIDCDEFIAFFVLFTDEEIQARNLRKLAHLLQYSNPVRMTFDNTSVIDQLESELVVMDDHFARATACNQLAKWYAEMDNKFDAMRCRRLCWDCHPEYHENVIPLILGELELDNVDAALNYSQEIFSLVPKNPTVMQDLLYIYESEKYWVYFEKLIDRLKQQYKNDEILGNIFVHFAMYLANSEQEEKSIEHFKLAREMFRNVDEEHYVIQQIDDVLGEKE